MKEMTIDIKDEHYEEFMKFMEEYIANGLVKIVSTTNVDNK